MAHGYIGLWTHSYSDLTSQGRIHAHDAVNSIPDKANPVDVMIIIDGPRPGINPGTSSPQGEHANGYINGALVSY